MNTLEFLSHLRRLDVRLAADGDALRCRGPQGVLTPELVAELQRRKAEVLPYFTPAPATTTADPIPRVSRDGELPLSFGQQQLWFMDRLAPGNPAYNLSLAATLTGPLRVSVLQQSLTTIVDRHEVLRTVFRDIDGRPVQIIRPPADLPVPVLDLNGVDPTEREAQLQRLAREHARRPFDLSTGPLFQAELIRLEDTQHVLLLRMHHAVADGWSVAIFVRELATAYSAFIAGERPRLADLPTQYADYAVWQRQRLQGHAFERLAGYWRQQFASPAPALPLGKGAARPARLADRGAKHRFVLEGPLTQALVRLSLCEGVTPFMAWMSVLHVILGRYAGESDVSIGFPVANRTHPAIEPLIGFFANTLVLRQNLRNPTFRDLVGHVRQLTVDALAHADLPFDQVVEIVSPERALGTNPLFQVMLSMQNEWVPSTDFGGVTLRPIDIDNQTAKFDLNIHVSASTGSTHGWIQYRDGLFDRQDAERMAGHIRTLLEGIVANPEGRIHAFPMLTENERRALVAIPAVDAAAPSRCRLEERFETHSRRTPDRVAVVANGKRLTYGELNRLATTLAVRLRALGVGPDVPVGICLDRSVDIVTAILATLKAGGAYLPIDPALPRERLALLLAEAQPRVVLAHSHLVARLPIDISLIVCLDDEVVGTGDVPLCDGLSLQDLAYLIPTSGSTGVPKTVAISHQAVLNLIQGLHETVYADLGDGPLEVGVNGPLAFDTSVKQIFQIVQGHTLHILADDLRADPYALLASLRAEPLDVLDCTPSQLRLLVEAGLLEDDRFAALTLLVGGEPLEAALWDRLAAAPGRRFFNLYGPTECTVDATVCRVRGEGTRPEIGRPLANVRAYVLDAQMQLLPVGIAGELYIGGAGVGRGYRRRPALTAASFLPDPFADEGVGARMYRTRDAVRWLETGGLEFIGRSDRMVKLRGHRVELQEIEEALRRHPGIRLAAVSVREERTGDARLVAYVMPVSPGTPSGPELQRFLSRVLPRHMVPAQFVSIDKLPLNPNGKTDYRGLPDPGNAWVEPRSDAHPPRDIIELELVRIWEDLLRVGPVGVGDDFFQLGGHSLLALMLVARIKERLGRDLPLSALFRGATVEQLAAELRRTPTSSRWSALVAIQSRGANEPIFCVHPAGGHVLSYVELTAALGLSQPVYGLQSSPHDSETDTRSIEAMASHYIDEIRAVRPRGPYRLVGWSMGGAIAFEMARQLVANGDPINLLGLVDTHAPGWANPAGPVRANSLLAKFARDLGGRTGTDAFGAAIRSVGAGDEVIRLLDVAIENGVLPPDTSEQHLRGMLHRFKANIRAQQMYKPCVAPVAVTLIQSNTTAARASDPNMGWTGLASRGVTRHVVPGDHYSIMRRPDVHAVARVIAASLSQVSDPGDAREATSAEVTGVRLG